MNILEDCSKRELEILNFFAEAYEKEPKKLRKNLLSIPLWERAKVLAFLKLRIPELHKNIEKLIYGGNNDK